MAKQKQEFSGKVRSVKGKWVGPWLPQWHDHQEGGPFSRLKAIYDEVQSAPDGLYSKRAALKESGRYTDAGISEMLRQTATESTVPAIRKAAAEKLRKYRRDIDTRRANLKPFDHDPKDIVGEMRRQEIRQWLRGLPAGERSTAVRRASDPAIIEAAISAPIELTGLEKSTRDDMERQLVELRHGDEIVVLDELEAAVETVERAVDGARDDVRETLGMTEPDFNAEFGPLEDEIDRLAVLKMEKDRTVIDFDNIAASVKAMNADERDKLVGMIRNEATRADHRAFRDGIAKMSGKAA
jgi:hypothetical protein